MINLLVTSLLIAPDVGSMIVVTSGVEDCNVVKSSVVM